MKNISAILILATLISSCAKQPEAAFTPSKTSVYEGEEITFNNTSTDAETSEWDFGDGTTSTEMSPKKKFDKEGSYAVTLNAFSKKKKKEDETSKTITVNKLFLKATVNGTEEIYQNDGNTEIVHSASKLVNACGDGNSTGEFETFVGANGKDYWFWIGTMTWECGYSPENADFKTFFGPRGFSYSFEGKNGVEIRYKDGSSSDYNWSTAKGTANQSGSTFTITSVTHEEAFGSYYVWVKGTFSAKLYDDAGNMKTFSGTFNIPFENL